MEYVNIDIYNIKNIELKIESYDFVFYNYIIHKSNCTFYKKNYYISK